ncbi:hypothetical protein Landi51_03741 [Colletotrichum acutatum]
METTTEVETKQPSVAPSEPQQQTPVAETPTTTDGEVIHWVDFDFTFDLELPAIPSQPSTRVLASFSTSQPAPTFTFAFTSVSVLWLHGNSSPSLPDTASDGASSFGH